MKLKQKKPFYLTILSSELERIKCTGISETELINLIAEIMHNKNKGVIKSVVNPDTKIKVPNGYQGIYIYPAIKLEKNSSPILINILIKSFDKNFEHIETWQKHFLKK